MSYIGAGVEYALHCLLWIGDPMEESRSARDLADFQGVSSSFVSKIFSKLEKAGIVAATDGIRGGYRLARATEDISVLDVIDAVDGHKALFECQEIRRGCILYQNKPPAWATRGVCAIHAVMLQAEKSLREELSRTRLCDLSASFQKLRMPSGFVDQAQDWFGERQVARERTRIAAVRGMRSRSTPSE